MPPADNQLPLLLTVDNAGFQLSICKRRVYGLAAQGLLDLVKVGAKSTRVTSASVLRLVAQGGRPASSVPGLKQFKDQQPPADAPTDGC